MTAILLDTNVLLALAWPNHQHHGTAQRWFKREAPRGWATCALTQLGFVRLSSNPAYPSRRLPVGRGGTARTADGLRATPVLGRVGARRCECVRNGARSSSGDGCLPRPRGGTPSRPLGDVRSAAHGACRETRDGGGPGTGRVRPRPAPPWLHGDGHDLPLDAARVGNLCDPQVVDGLQVEPRVGIAAESRCRHIHQVIDI